MLILFWGITLLNCFGIKISSFASTLSALVGIILPTAILVAFGISWMASVSPSQIHFTLKSLLPNLQDPSQLAFLTQVIISLIGLEMAFVHAGDVKNPNRNVPKAIFSSAALILLIVIAAPLSIAIVIPSKDINVVAGLLDAFSVFFGHFQISSLMFSLMLVLIFIGNCGNVTAWMISSTRGMHVASRECHMPNFMQKTNRYEAPLGILLLEAFIFSICALCFLLFESVSNAYWILLILASQVALLYYLLIFLAAVKNKKQNSAPSSFRIPGGVFGTAFAATLASISCISAIVFGFFPPEQGSVTGGQKYPYLLGTGIIVTLTIPFLLLKMRKSSNHLAK
jgi:amino acid transporter